MGAVENTSFFVCFLVLLLPGGVSSVHAADTPFAKIFGGFLSNAMSLFLKWLWSLKPISKTAISGHSLMKFESGYIVETVFDGSKLGIEPYAIEVSRNGELLLLDSTNSNIYKIPAQLSPRSRPKLVAGSPDGYFGHIDGKPRESRLNHPKGFTVDDKGNIYVADTMNMAIRKITDAGVTTIAGGKSSRGGHVDGASEDAKFSNDFDIVYIGSSCSLLVIDRGDQAVREIQLHFDDCSYHNGAEFTIGIAMLVVAGLFGYMLAFLQCKVGIAASQNGQGQTKSNVSVSPYKKSSKPVRPPLIPKEDELVKQEESFLGSIFKLVLSFGASAFEIFGGFIPGSRRTAIGGQYQNHGKWQHSTPWPVQDSFVIPDGDEAPPSAEPRTPNTQKMYPFMSKGPEKLRQWHQGQALYNGWNEDLHHQHDQQKQKHHRCQFSLPHTFYETGYDKTCEVVFGAV